MPTGMPTGSFLPVGTGMHPGCVRFRFPTGMVIMGGVRALCVTVTVLVILLIINRFSLSLHWYC